MNNTSLNSKEELEFDPSIPEDERRFYLKAYTNVNHVRERKVHCTICKMHIGTAPCNESIIRMHPILRVTHCKKCHDFYNSGEFSKGEDGSELYCRWCGQGGEVYCCSNCPFVFCKSCIISNLSRGVVADIEQNENWSCFNCAPKMLWPLRAQHWALIKFIDKQKKAILNSNLSDAEIKVQMTKDRSLCCKIKKPSGYGTDSSDSSDISLSRLKKKVGEKRSRKSLSKEDLTGGVSPAGQAKRAKGNDEVVCTPDVMSMLEPECTLTVPSNAKQITSQQPSTPSPKIMSIQPAKPLITPPLLIRSAPAPVVRPPAPVLKKTVVAPRVAGGPGTDFNTPVYHTINGYRIDLNSAAQQETVRLPNGKLIQVKRQGTGPQAVTTVQSAANQSSTPNRIVHNISQPALSPIATVPAQQIVHSSGGHIIRSQLQTPRPLTIQNGPIVPQFQQHQQPSPVQQQFQQITIRQPNQQIATIRYQGNTQQQMNNMIQNGTMQILNGTQVTAAAGTQIPNVRQLPTFIKQFFPNTPLGQSRTQLQNQIFNAMEICQHLMGKLQTLTNSNAYKTAKSMTDVKELYIHLSYLLTYAIGRFKGLQDNCLSDMRDLGFTNDANSLENGQLAAGMDMVRSGLITDFSSVDLESFHSLIVQNMKNLKPATDSSATSDGPVETFESSKKLTHLNYNRFIIGQNPYNPNISDLEINDDDEEDCLLVELSKQNNLEQIDIESEREEDEEEEDCLLVELGDRYSEKETPSTSPLLEEDIEEDDFVHPGLITSYEKDDDFELGDADKDKDGEIMSGQFTYEHDLKLIEILKDYPQLWYPQLTRTKFETMDTLWKKINKQMPKKQASDAEEDEISIVEPQTDTINLDSDNEDDLPPPKKPNVNIPTPSVITNTSSIAVNNHHIINPPDPTPIVTPTTTTNADDELTAEYDFSNVASLLAGMLEVELTEGGTDCIQPPKKPRKKTTNKPNPTLVKQKEMQERERLENIKKNCSKLKMEVQIPLNKVEDIYEYAKPMLEDLKQEKLEAEKIEAEEVELKKKEEEENNTQIEEELGEDEKKETASETDINKTNPEVDADDKEESEEVVVVLLEEQDNSKEDDETVELIDHDESQESICDPIQEEDVSVCPDDSSTENYKRKDKEDVMLAVGDKENEEEESKEEEQEKVIEKSKGDDEKEDVMEEEEETEVHKVGDNKDVMEERKETEGDKVDEEKEDVIEDEETEVDKEDGMEEEETEVDKVDEDKEDVMEEEETEVDKVDEDKEDVIEDEETEVDKEDGMEEKETEVDKVDKDKELAVEEEETELDKVNEDNEDGETEILIEPDNKKCSELPLATEDATNLDPLQADESSKELHVPQEITENNDTNVENDLESTSLSHNYSTVLGRTEVA